MAQNEREDVGLRCAQGDAQTDLARALRHGKREQAVKTNGGDQQRQRGKAFQQTRDQRLAAKGIFDGFVNGFYVGGGGVGSNLVQHFVKLRPERIGWDRAADRYLNEGCGDAVERRPRLHLRQAEIDLRLGGIDDLSLLHVPDDANDRASRQIVPPCPWKGRGRSDPGRASTYERRPGLRPQRRAQRWYRPP